MTPTTLLSYFAPLCPHVIVWQGLQGRDAFGKPTYGAAKEFRGRRAFKLERHASKGQATIGQGIDTISESTIWILATPDVQYDDRVYVKGDKEPYPPIVNIERYPGTTGDLYVKVSLGSANG